jgi:hypothetical protein
MRDELITAFFSLPDHRQRLKIKRPADTGIVCTDLVSGVARGLRAFANIGQ